MSTKKEQIEAWLARPIQVGDSVYCKGLGLNNPELNQLHEVIKVDKDAVYIQQYGYNSLTLVPMDKVSKDITRCGAYPFAKELRLNVQLQNIEGIMSGIGYDADTKRPFKRTRHEFFPGIQEVCFNPMVIDKDGNEIEYQRGLVWNLEQKQLLIESIYNWVDIGKIVLRLRPFEWVEKRVKAGKLEHTAFKDVVDGKQRLNAIMEFIQCNFNDMCGNNWDDLSERAKKTFLNFSQVSYVQLDEDSTDADALRTFMSINHAGKPMSREHLEFVKSINLK